MEDSHSNTTLNDEQSNSGLSAMARLGWIAAGPVAMLMLGMSIAKLPAWSLGIRDVLFWGVAVLVGLLRSLDVTKLHGQDANGRPATNAQLWRYLMGLVMVAAVVWLGAQSTGF